MTRAKDISKIVTDADLSGTLDVTGTVTAGAVAVEGASGAQITITDNSPSTVSLYMGAGNSSVSIGSTTSDPLTFLTANTERMRIDSSGHVTMPYQSAFLARCGSGDNDNIPINAGTTISFTTEVFDQNSDFNLSTNVFTAPVTGKYQLNMSLVLGNGDTATDYIQAEIQASNRSFYWIIDPDNWDQDGTYFTATTVGLMDMDANDTAKIVVYMSNTGAAQMDTLNYCYFSGYLVA